MTTGIERRTLLDDGIVRLRVFALGLVTRPLDIARLLPRPRLLWAYLRLWALRYRASPYRWPRGYDAVFALKQAGQSRGSVAYGETPVYVAARLLARWGLDAQGHCLDPCAGRGRVLLAARLLGARATGVEVNPEHVEHAGAVLAAAGATLRVGDGADPAHHRDATHVFVCWTAFSADLRARFEGAFASLPPGAVVMTMTYPCDRPDLELLDEVTVLANWGPEPVFVYRRR